MAKIYYELIHLGLREVEQVPLTWRQEVQNLLDADEENAE